MDRSCLARWRLVPRVALCAESIGVLEQLPHIFAIELRSVRITKIRPDVRQVEIRSVVLRSLINPLQIADALGLNQRTDSPIADAQGVAFRSVPVRVQFPVANDIHMKLASVGSPGNSLHLHQTARWVKEYLSDYAAVHVHFLKMLAVNIHIDHDR